MSATFTDPFGGIHRDEWDELATGRLYSSSRWIEFCSADGTALPGAVSGRTSAGALAALPVTAVRTESNPFYRWNDVLREAGLPVLPEEGVLAGPRRGYQTHLLGDGSREELADALLDELRHAPWHAVEAGALTPGREVPCVAMYATTEDVVALRRAGVRTTPVLLRPDAWIPVPAGDWASWLAAVPSRRRAELIRREVRRFEAAGYEVVETTLGRTSDVAGALIANTEAKYGRQIVPGAHAKLLGAQAGAMGDSARVVLCRRDGVPVGYCCYYLCGDTLFLRSAGFDYDRLAGAAEYFNIVYYLPIRIALRSGARRIHAGIEAAEAKALRGAELRPLWMLDLTEGGSLVGFDRIIRRHNARLSARISGTSAAVAKSWLSAVSSTPAEFGLLDEVSAGEREHGPAAVG